MRQTGWLKTTGIYCLIILSLAVQNQGVGRAMVPLKSVRVAPSWPLSCSGCQAWASFDLQLHYYNLCLSCHMCFALYVSLSLSSKDISHTD